MSFIRLSPNKIAASALVLGMFSGCATQPAEPPPAPPPAVASQTPTPPPVPTKRAGELALAEGVDLYNQGNYAAAIKKLQESGEIWGEAAPIRIEALKYIAFASCVSNLRAQCRQSFDRLLELDPNFDLAPAEAGHPIWSPVFQQAKRALASPARRPTTPPQPR